MIRRLLRTARSGVGLRARLTVIYSGLFFAAGSALLLVTYLLTASALEREFYPPPIDSAVPVPDGRPKVFALRITRDFAYRIEQGKEQVLGDLLQNSALVMVAVGVLAIILGHFVAARALRPLSRVTETARRLSESTLHERIALQGPNDDVKRLADTFDAMLDRLQRAFDTQRRFVLNASHELRTPLAINRTLLEVALEDPEPSEDLVRLGTALLATTARHERLIEGLLLLTRSEHEVVASRAVQVDEVVRAVEDSLRATARRRRVVMTARLDPAVAAGDPVLIERCVYNLVENALKYNVKDGTVETAVTREDGQVVVRVENSGVPIPGHEVGELFEPFRRLHDRVGSAHGSGLGLSIVRAIVTAHRGRVEAAARPEGGLRVTVHLPAA
ncbi:HAMP domain-containing sensor histidine kinase [Sphaerisporangium sp. TRM90804]|uniref:HAMP domain-containing sensor histidine kinase n=1 Tax=Sphaerisporangium sp. TRM90804 TaxID=3031113 RepID=UPI0024478F10|nr:HAMP domain-containing sensor histidine kinase [Sphaerisporangium sp. TRM90804]MDH2427481.1 HAMP domain-containing sensor histidine kinase [Sphaerisporangium sp. TRM90804]